MAALLRGAPSGLNATAAVMKQLPPDVLAQMCQDVMQFLQFKSGTANVVQLVNKAQAGGCICGASSIQSAVNSLSYIYRYAAKEKLDESSLANQLKTSSCWPEDVVSTITHVWKEQPSVCPPDCGKLVYSLASRPDIQKLSNLGALLTSSELAAQLLQVGKLVDLQWKLGVAMSSSECRNLTAPYISVLLKVADPSGKVITKSFEMSLMEFQNFSSQVKDMASSLETV